MATPEQGTDELAVLMPRTRALHDRSAVDVANLRKYMAASEHDPALTNSQRSSVIIRNDIRRDEEGFEDIDEFWAEDDVLEDKDETEDETETSMFSEGTASSVNVSMASTTSEMEVNLSGLGYASSDDDNHDGDLDDNDRTDHARATGDRAVHLRADNQVKKALKSQNALKSQKQSADLSTPRPSKKSPDSMAAPKKTPTPERRRQSTASSTVAPEPDISFGGASTPGSSGKKSKGSPDSQRKTSLGTPPSAPGAKASQKKKLRRQSRDSFGDTAEFDRASSPFSINDAILTPLSNASEKNLGSIKPFSDRSSSNSPNIRVKLFKSKKSDLLEGDETQQKPRPKKLAKQGTSTPTKKRRKVVYKSSPATDMSMNEGVDDDASYLANTSIDGDDSDSGDEKSVQETSVAKSGRDADLSYADEILQDGDDHDGESGLRRSKRKRFKPLAWYKGEHYVYERRQSGVGLVMPTVAGIERAGTRTPLKKERVAKKTIRPRIQKKFPRDDLPKNYEYEDGEWADLWDNAAGCINKMNIICRSDEIEHRSLPSVDGEEPGFAGQSFNLKNATPFSRWICGNLGLPPGAAKDAESVGDAVQVFHVMGCQPQSLEVAIGPVEGEYFDPNAATRFLLSPNDEFYIPSRNAYFLKNHSKTTTAELHFMILKPNSSKAKENERQSSASVTTPPKAKEKN